MGVCGLKKLLVVRSFVLFWDGLYPRLAWNSRVVKRGFELLILLHLPPEFGDYRCAPAWPVSAGLRIKYRTKQRRWSGSGPDVPGSSSTLPTKQGGGLSPGQMFPSSWSLIPRIENKGSHLIFCRKIKKTIQSKDWQRATLARVLRAPVTVWGSLLWVSRGVCLLRGVVWAVLIDQVISSFLYYTCPFPYCIILITYAPNYAWA